ncbi:hypothetical protein PMI06_006660 [Burkholderia sp. BT03]|nr:hypothetical protein PMI06_006660 [Burkholderia sp. BT03]
MTGWSTLSTAGLPLALVARIRRIYVRKRLLRWPNLEGYLGPMSVNRIGQRSAQIVSKHELVVLK